MTQMSDLIEQLAYARQVEAERKAEYVAVKAEINAEIEERYGHYLGRIEASLETAKTEVSETEIAIRAAALVEFEASGNKRPHPAVGIREMTRLEYDDSDAFRYCTEHLTTALRMNRRKFEKVAKAAELDFVDILKEPQVTIARDLSAYVETDG